MFYQRCFRVHRQIFLCKADDFFAALDNVDFSSSKLLSTIDKENTYYPLEGYLFADTYEFYFCGCKICAGEKGKEKDYLLCSTIERVAPAVIAKERKIYKGVSANIDFYSGFVYDMLKLPHELYTPLFAIARIAGWSAHRIEEIHNAGKIIRPAYMAVQEHREYIPMKDR